MPVTTDPVTLRRQTIVARIVAIMAIAFLVLSHSVKLHWPTSSVQPTTTSTPVVAPLLTPPAATAVPKFAARRPARAELGVPQVYFTPSEDGIAAAVIAALGPDEAGVSIHCQSYVLSHKGIAQALIDAKKRGLEVVVICDAHGAKMNGSCVNMLLDGGVTTYIDSRHAIAHNKIMIVDNRVVLTGSFNWTNAAEHANAENLIMFLDTVRAEVYESNFQVHLKHAVRLTKPLPAAAAKRAIDEPDF